MMASMIRAAEVAAEISTHRLLVLIDRQPDQINVTGTLRDAHGAHLHVISHPITWARFDREPDALGNAVRQLHEHLMSTWERHCLG